MVFIALAMALLSGPISAQESRGAIVIPVEIIARVVLVTGNINGQGPFTLILDTGATETVITPRVAERLGLRTIGPPGGQKSAWVDTLAVGKAVTRRLPVMVFDPPQALPLRLDKGINYHGLLGYSFLSRFVTYLDYRGGCVRFDPLPPSSSGLDGATERGHRIGFRLRDRLILVGAMIEGKGPLTLVFDTGSAENVLSAVAARKVGLVTVPLTGYANVRISPACAISVGTAKAEKVSVVVLDDPGDLEFVHGTDGILGYPFLSNFSVTVNYRDRLIILEPYDCAAVR